MLLFKSHSYFFSIWFQFRFQFRSLPSPWIFNHEFLQLKDQIFSFFILPICAKTFSCRITFPFDWVLCQNQSVSISLGAQNIISQLCWWNNRETVLKVNSVVQNLFISHIPKKLCYEIGYMFLTSLDIVRYRFWNYFCKIFYNEFTRF